MVERMRAPMRPLPERVSRWTSYVGALRWLDALAACLGWWLAFTVVLPDLTEGERAALAALATIACTFLPSLRVRWRPLSAVVGLYVSSRLRPGDRAWFVRPGDARLVLVTGRRRLRLVIAAPDQERDEGLIIRRTRVLVVPE